MSARTLRIAMVALAAVGLGVATYLTVIHYAGIKPLCGKSGGCEIVQSSKYSKVAGVPVALIGLIGYIAILGSLLARETEASRLAAAVLVLGGFGFSGYLTYRELYSIHHICPWCVSSAVILTLLLPLALWRFLRGDQPSTGSAGARHAAESPTAAGTPS
jgi:uncharacterized membrane protein